MSREADELLERCIEAARAGGDPEVILRAHPDLAEAVRPLAALARELEGFPAEAASPAGLSRLLGKVAAAEAAPAPKRRRRLLRAAIWASAAAAVAILAGWGLVRTAQGALPGDRLYRVKRFGEGARCLLAFVPERKAELRLRFADERLHETYRKHLDGRGLDAALLEQMARETRRALAIAGRLPAARLGGVLEQAAWSFHHQCNMMEELERRVSAEEKAVLAPYAASCRKLCECLQLGPWGDQPGAAEEAVVRLRNLATEGSVEP